MRKNEQKQDSYKDSFFEFQLDILKTEISHLRTIIEGLDKITQQIKNWTIVIWAGSISLIISSSNIEMRKYIFFIVTIPFLFWIIDAHFRRRQRQFLYRNKKISEFINSENLEASFEEKKLKDFILLDPLGKQYYKKDIKEYANIKKSMWFKTMKTFYLGLILVTVLMQIVLYPRNINQNTKSTTLIEHSDSLVFRNQNIIINELKSLKIEIDSLKSKNWRTINVGQ
jgi:hypothetical protein